MGIVIIVLLLLLAIKVTGWMIKLCGKLIGALFSLGGYLIIGGLAVFGFGLALVVIPIVLVAGIITVVALVAVN